MTRTQPGLMPSQPVAIWRLELVGVLEVDAEQPVPVRAGAGAAAAGLDAEQVVEQRDHEVVVQVLAARRPDHERHDREPLRPPGCRGSPCAGSLRQAVIARSQQGVLACLDHVDADGVLELEDQPGPDRLDDGRGAALLAVDGVGEVAVLGGLTYITVPPPGTAGTRLVSSSRRTTSTPGRPGSADELVRGDEDRVQVARPGAVGRGACRW